MNNRNEKGQFVGKWKTGVRNNIKEYNSWKNARHRCYDPKCDHYYLYGKRGIKMCERWLNNFDAFLEDMGKCPDGFSLDRIDYNGSYEPQNCRWADKTTQSTNRRITRFFDYNGESLTIPEMSRKYGIKRSTLSMCIYSYGWTVREAVETSVCARRVQLPQ